MAWLARRQLLGGTLGAAGLAAAYVLLGPSDQSRALGVLREVLSSLAAPGAGDDERARRHRVASALSRLTSPTLRVTAPELGVVEGHAALLELLEQASGIRFDVDVEQSNVRVDEKGADATLLVAFALSFGGERRKQVRTLACELTRRGKSFLVVQIAASGVSREQPEARP